ncbi:MAG: formate--tetrahydrofolate ligase [Dehalococcoidia bacterium]
MKPIEEVAESLGLSEAEWEPYGRYKAKLTQAGIDRPANGRQAKLVLVTAMTPTPAGEGKTTTSLGLAHGLWRVGKRSVACLREPSLGPVFGVKGGGTGGGKSEMVPADDINLHFNGDIHAVTAANNLLAAAIDNSLFQENPTGLDARRVSWQRCLDVNDRSLRHIILGLGGTADGVPREGGFTITAASEIMALSTLATSLNDLTVRLGRIIVGHTHDGKAVTAHDLGMEGSLALLLREAMRPNLVQTSEGTPVLAHMGPFGNIALGANSLLATRSALKLADVAITEGGFASDLGAEKFFDVVARLGNFHPDAAVIVATVRGLRWHGGVKANELGRPNRQAVETGLVNLGKHIENVRRFGVPAVVAVNRFTDDPQDELDAVVEYAHAQGAAAAVANPYNEGGAGCEGLAHELLGLMEREESRYQPLYDLKLSPLEKIETIAREVYGADGIEVDAAARADIRRAEADGAAALPICMAKTHLSISDNPRRLGRPSGFRVHVRRVLYHAGAGYLVVLAGDINTMPGLPKVPSALHIGLDAEGRTVGLT